MKNRVLLSLTLAFALFSVFVFYNQGITGYITYDTCPAPAITSSVDITDDTPTTGNCGGSSGLSVTASSVTVDCNDNYINGGGAGQFTTGIAVSGSLTGVTIQNCKIKDFETGISTGGSAVTLINVDVYTDGGGVTCFSGAYTDGGDVYCGAEAAAPLPDNDPVISSLDHPENDATVTSVPLDFNFTVYDDWNITNCSLYTNFSGEWDTSANLTNLFTNHSTQYNFTMEPADGEYIWNVYCLDNGSQYDWYTTNYSVTINTTDPAPVITALTHPAASYNASQDPLDFNFTVYDNYNVSNCSLWTNISGSWAESGFREIQTNVSATYNISTVVGGGIYLWNINCTDNASNSTWYTNQTLTVTDPAPYISALSPSNASTTTAVPLNFSFTVLDNYNVSNCSLWSNFGGSWAENVTLIIQNKTEGTYNITLSPNDGTYLWNVNCTDNSSQTTWFDNYSLTIEAVDSDPVVTLSSPDNASTVTASSASLQFLTSDDRNVSNCSLWTNFTGDWAENETVNISTGDSTTTTFTVTPAYGTYLWNANCTDNGSNSVWATANYTFTLAQASTPPNNGGGGSSGDDDDEDDDTPVITIPEPPIEPPEEEPEEEDEPPVEEEFSPPEEDVDEDEEESIDNAPKSKRDIVEVECDSSKEDCDAWFDNLIDKMDRTLDKVDLNKSISYNNETNTTKVAITITAEEDLDDFKYYQSIPKCMAIYVHMVKFKNTDFEVLKDDPLIVWSFANVEQGEELDLGFEVMGNVPEDCHEFLAELLYEQEERFSSKHMLGLITGLAVLGLVAGGITFSSKHSHKLVSLKNKIVKTKKPKVKSKPKPKPKDKDPYKRLDDSMSNIKERLKNL